MKTVTLFRSSFLIIMLLLLAGPVAAQALAMNASDPEPMPGLSYFRQDAVAGDFVTPATRKTKEPMTRTIVYRAEEDSYSVRIIDAQGQLRVAGSYADSVLLVPHGHFNYYYANGQRESDGEYVNGRKAGTWHCYTESGEPRADRYYHGLEWDDLQIVVGAATRATRHAF